MVFKKELYIKRLAQRELLENILAVIDRYKSISDLKGRLQRMLVEIEEELRAYTIENDPIYHSLIQKTPIPQEA